MVTSDPDLPEPVWDAEGRTARLKQIALDLPEAQMVHVEAWDHPTFRVRNKNFVFAAADASGISVKLPKEEAAWVVASVPGAQPTGYGLGRHGWVSVTTPPADDDAGWRQMAEWIRESYRLIAPKTLGAKLDLP